MLLPLPGDLPELLHLRESPLLRRRSFEEFEVGKDGLQHVLIVSCGEKGQPSASGVRGGRTEAAGGQAETDSEEVEPRCA